VHGNPHVCVSIGLTVGHELTVGVVYAPVLNELFEATHDGPALLNGCLIGVSDVDDLSSACVVLEFGSDRAKAKVDWMSQNLRSILVNSVQCIRAYGSCALDMCYVAAGRVDAYTEYGP
jgi:fructose-1,6-bisphosphatase/inositol monophosphatase family enzyme